MNLFVLDKDYTQAAIYNQDLHVRKICVESAQILQNAYSLDKLKEAPKTQVGNSRSHSYFNHPVCVWARRNINNFHWALFHAAALHEEFEYRFGKKHFSSRFIEWAFKNEPELSSESFSDHPQCFGSFEHLIKPGNPIEGYRDYYRKAKMSFKFGNKIIPASWTKRNTPEWVK